MTDETSADSGDAESARNLVGELPSRRTVLKASSALGLTAATGLGAASQDDEEEEEEDEEEEEEEVAEVEFLNQTTDGSTVTVEEVELPEGGYVAVHDTSLLDGEVLASVIGVSEYLEDGGEDVEVELFDVPGGDFDDDELTETQALIAMPHQETNDNEEYNFVETEGEEDGPYTNDEFPVVDIAYAVVE